MFAYGKFAAGFTWRKKQPCTLLKKHRKMEKAVFICHNDLLFRNFVLGQWNFN